MSVEQKKAVPSAKPEASSSLNITIAVVAIIAIALGSLLIGENSEVEDVENMVNVPELKDVQNPASRLRWNVSVPLSFPGAKPLPSVPYNRNDPDFIDSLFEKGQPCILKGTPASTMPALKRWTPQYVENLIDEITVHLPSKSEIRMHQEDSMQPFASLPINWTRPWVEKTVSSSLFFTGSKLMYGMMNLKKLPDEMRRDVEIGSLTVGYSPPMEVNLWMGVPTVTTPAHYDLVHNLYTQISGHKRFIIFPPDDAESLYTFSSLHPSSRMTQIDFNDAQAVQKFPKFANVHPFEVILNPGDVLYLPPYTFHHVTAVGTGVSMSISTHTESNIAKLRERLIGRTEAVFFSNQIPTLETSIRVACLDAYMKAVFASDDERRQFIKRMIDAHWSHVNIDRDAPGLYDLIQAAKSQFPSEDEITETSSSSNPIIATLFNKMALAGKDVRDLMKGQASAAVLDIFLMSHLEWVSSIALRDSLLVDAYLRHASL
eukprot:TRINITY_DN4179_c0_g1_i1.p1 TRINITY_DN4179_c0_g1~~TRINITY_DN4179_c0_g1_i1.p1  ORF type:complete len:488 (+),score=123.37 TRINITY_DN4179_c0_g1_i1:570-2033(+)